MVVERLAFALPLAGAPVNAALAVPRLSGRRVLRWSRKLPACSGFYWWPVS